jgi:hypothetical protein
MAWLPTRRERILLFGGSKAGKSFTYLGLMHFARLTKTDSHFWIIDNDNATEAIGLYPGGTHGDLLGEQRGEEMGEELTKLEYEKATIWIPETFDSYHGIADQIRKDVQPEDWIVIDMLSNLWEIMPDWWIGNVYGENSWEYYAAVRKSIEAGDEGSGERGFGGHSGVDWQYIGKVYRKWEKRLTLYAPCHVIAYSAESEIQAHHDKTGEKRAQYAITSNFAPKTEKGASHRFHTVGRVQKRLGRDGKTAKERTITFVGDRDREAMLDERLGRSQTLTLSEGPKFAQDYLVKIAGWKMTGG